jgi:hypothetical protein
MKQILMALAITAIACSSTEAQMSCKAKTVTRHRTAMRTLPKQKTVSETRVCRMVPYQVCTIMPDRRSVSCYKTTDPEDFTPMNSETTYYGATGKMPNEKEPSNIETIIIPGKPWQDHCKRDEAGKATVCTYSGLRLNRTADGYYYYQQVPKESSSMPVTDGNVDVPASNALTLQQ